MNIIDLRSDTITQATEGMRKAISQAIVGDDVYGDDPTTLDFEANLAELFGHEAALFMPTGTMSNQVALRVHTQSGDEILAEQHSHILYYESGAPAALSGLLVRQLQGTRGLFDAPTLQKQLRLTENVHFAPQKLVCIENTHNRGGGSVWPFDQFQSVCHLTHQKGLKVHMDGARLWNACVASQQPEKAWASSCDSLSVCFSKGLGAPIGSALIGPKDFITTARRFRKMFGGGMRQVGHLTAAAQYALDHHRALLPADHERAKELAQQLNQIDGLQIELDQIDTNIIFIKTSQKAQVWQSELKTKGLLIGLESEHLLRGVTHFLFDDSKLQKSIDLFKEVALNV